MLWLRVFIIFACFGLQFTIFLFDCLFHKDNMAQVENGRVIAIFNSLFAGFYIVFLITLTMIDVSKKAAKNMTFVSAFGTILILFPTELSILSFLNNLNHIKSVDTIMGKTICTIILVALIMCLDFMYFTFDFNIEQTLDSNNQILWLLRIGIYLSTAFILGFILAMNALMLYDIANQRS